MYWFIFGIVGNVHAQIKPTDAGENPSTSTASVIIYYYSVQKLRLIVIFTFQFEIKFINIIDIWLKESQNILVGIFWHTSCCSFRSSGDKKLHEMAR